MMNAEEQVRRERANEFAAEWSSAIQKLGYHFALPMSVLAPDVRDKILALEANARQPTAFVCGVLTVAQLRGMIGWWADALKAASIDALKANAPVVLQ
jgi:hypothetical protein